MPSKEIPTIIEEQTVMPSVDDTSDLAAEFFNGLPIKEPVQQPVQVPVQQPPVESPNLNEILEDAPNGYREQSVSVKVNDEYLKEIIGLGREELLDVVPVGSFMTGSRVRLMAYYLKLGFHGESLREVMDSGEVLMPYDRMLGIRYSLHDRYLPEEIGVSDLDIVTYPRNYPNTSELLPSRTYPNQAHARMVYQAEDGREREIHYHSYPQVGDVNDVRELHLRSEPTMFAFRLERGEDDNFYMVDPLNALGIGDEKSREGAHDWHWDGDEVNPEMLKHFKEYPHLYRFRGAVVASLNLITKLDRYYNKKSLQTFRDGLNVEELITEYEENPAAKESFREFMRRALVTKMYSQEHFLGALAEIGILDFVKSVMLEDLKPEESEVDRFVSWIFTKRAKFIQHFYDKGQLWRNEMWDAIKRGWTIKNEDFASDI